MSQFDRIQKLIAHNERAIADYRAVDCDIYYRPDRTNDKWFVRLMEKHGIPPATEARFTPGKVSVLMVND